MITTITKNCLNCEQPFEAKPSEVNRGNAKYCTKKCTGEAIKKQRIAKFALINTPNVECAYCKEMFYLSESKKKNSRSGLFFCCREHKDIAQRIGGIKEIQPPHYTNAGRVYRDIAFRNKQKICERCDYSKIPEVLVVHHKDRNRENNNIENLEVLCPTCHSEEHFNNKDGNWKQ
jgi:hypothetical protein